MARRSSNATLASRSDARRWSMMVSNALPVSAGCGAAVLEVARGGLERLQVALEAADHHDQREGSDERDAEEGAERGEGDLARGGGGLAVDVVARVAQREVAHREVEVVLERDAGHVFLGRLARPLGGLRARRRLGPRALHALAHARAVRAVDDLAGVVEDVDALDQLVGGLLALELRGERGELGELQAERQRRLDAVLDAATHHEHARLHHAADRALVLEVVQERRHADGKEADDKRNRDESDANRPHS